MKATGIVRRIVKYTDNRVLLRDAATCREKVYRVNMPANPVYHHTSVPPGAIRGAQESLYADRQKNSGRAAFVGFR